MKKIELRTVIKITTPEGELSALKSQSKDNIDLANDVVRELDDTDQQIKAIYNTSCNHRYFYPEKNMQICTKCGERIKFASNQ